MSSFQHATVSSERGITAHPKMNLNEYIVEGKCQTIPLIKQEGKIRRMRSLFPLRSLLVLMSCTDGFTGKQEEKRHSEWCSEQTESRRDEVAGGLLNNKPQRIRGYVNLQALQGNRLSKVNRNSSI